MWGKGRSTRHFDDGSSDATDRLFSFLRFGWSRRRPLASTGFRFLAQRIGADYPAKESGRLITLSSLVEPEIARDTTLMLAWYIVEELRKEVLVVDGTLGQLTAADAPEQEFEPGLTDLLRGDVGLDEVLTPAREGVWRLPPGAHPTGVAANFSAKEISAVLRQACARFPYVLLQHGPIRADTRYLAFAAEADLVLLLAEEGRTRMSEVEQSQSMFGEHKIADVRLLLTVPSPGARRGGGEGSE